MSGPGQATANICNTRGLHARASAKFVKLASAFDAEIRVTREGSTVDARSIMGLLMLGAGNGCSITGGGVYRGQAYSRLQGVYIYGDFCSGNIWALWRGTDGAAHNALVLPNAAAMTRGAARLVRACMLCLF